MASGNHGLKLGNVAVSPLAADRDLVAMADDLGGTAGQGGEHQGQRQ
jgi:hypothetical protein